MFVWKLFYYGKACIYFVILVFHIELDTGPFLIKLKKKLTDLLLQEVRKIFLKGEEDFRKHGHHLKSCLFKQEEAGEDASQPFRLT